MTLPEIYNSIVKNKLIKSFWNLITVIAPVATVIALVLSWLQSSELRTISNSLSTSFVGVFPDNMSEVNKLIDDTKHELLIITDVPAYGYFSNPEEFSKYELKLEEFKGKSNRTLKIITYGRDKRYNAMKEQFQKYNIDELKKTKTYQKFKRYWSDKGNNEKYQFDSMEMFFSKLEGAHLDLEYELKGKGALIKRDTLREKFPFYCWISDRNKVIFSFLNSETHEREVSFYSNDSELCKILSKIVENRFNDNLNEVYTSSMRLGKRKE